MLPFPAFGSELVEPRAALRASVDRVLGDLSSGTMPDAAELQRVDIKEEAGRRGKGGTLLVGSPNNLAAAQQLADEVACFANTPGGGALIVGIENRTGDLLGTALDPDWLRRSIYERVDVAPHVEERHVDGVRLLIIYVAMSPEPVEDTSDRLRWRVGASCQPVDRAEWWQHRQGAVGYDSMAVSTGRTADDATAGALLAARRYLFGATGDTEQRTDSNRDLLRRLGVLQPDGRLTQAGALVFCAADRSHLALTVVDVEGGDILSAPHDFTGLSVLEQLLAVEDRLDGLNTSLTVRGSFAEQLIRRLPVTAVREAVVNGLVHRDWLSTEPVTITWTEADSAIQVVSPGGFTGGISSENLLTQRFARHPALADLFRALGLVEKSGLGVDRMYREMVSLGHRPPVIVEDPGPRVRARLTGGQPVIPVMALMGRIEPAVRRRDVRVALIVDRLLRRPFTDGRDIAPILQRTEAESAEALDTAGECRVDAQPLLVRFKDVWVLSTAAVAVVEQAARAPERRARGILTYRRPQDPLVVVRPWLAVHDRITSGEHARLAGVTQAGALNQLDRLAREEFLTRGDGRGRNAHFLAGPRLSVGRT